MRRVHALGLAFLLCSPIAASAQRNCKKGIPCGGTCIAANKVCRISTSSEKPAPPKDSAADTIPTRWVASTRGRLYYKPDCASAKDLSPLNLRYFKSEDEAKKEGYTRSTAKGC